MFRKRSINVYNIDRATAGCWEPVGGKTIACGIASPFPLVPIIKAIGIRLAVVSLRTDDRALYDFLAKIKVSTA